MEPYDYKQFNWVLKHFKLCVSVKKDIEEHKEQ